MSEPLFSADDDDWVELEPAPSGKRLPDVSLRLGRQPRTGRVSAYLALRGDAGEHILAHGPRFRVMIGGREADRVKIVPDARSGPYEVSAFKGIARLWLGVVTAWPAEVRDPVECIWRRDGATTALLLALPAGFTRPTQTRPVLAPVRAPALLAAPMSPGISSIVAERDELRERLRQVEEEQKAIEWKIPERIGDASVPKFDRAVIALLIGRELVTKDAVLLATAEQPGEDERDAKIVDVIICRLRPKLATLGVEIRTHRGEGYSLSGTHRQALRRLFSVSTDGGAS